VVVCNKALEEYVPPVAGVCACLLLLDQRNSVWVVNGEEGGVGNIGWRGRLIRMEGCQEGGVIGGDRGVVRRAEFLQIIEETDQVLTKGFLLFEEEFDGGNGEVLRAIPKEDLYEGAAEEKVISNNHLWRSKVEEGIDGEVDDS